MRGSNLTGQVFGDLTVLSDSGKRSKNGLIIWKCQCNCGNITYIRGDNLKLGISRSCGKCYQKRYYEHPSGYMVGLTTNNEIFLFDKDDFDLIKSHTWHKTKRGYIATNINRKLIPMHKLILNSNAEIDHRNRDKTDNRRFNLRECTHKQNMSNMPKFKTNKSGYKGVSYCKKSGKWLAQITHNYKSIRLGYFDAPEKAASAYDEAAIKYFGEFANLNFKGLRQVV